MQPPFNYYGGKERMSTHILPLFPAHVRYVEPFLGGGSIFWAKTPSKSEVINDIDNKVVNFYEVLKTDWDLLEKKINNTLHSEYHYLLSKKILKEPMVDRIEYAWALWAACCLSFSHNIFGGFAFGNDGISSKNTRNTIKDFSMIYAKRLQNAEIFCRDAVDIIKLKDTHDTFFYIDPPYVSSDCGHYKGYTMEQFTELLDCISNIKGKFLLSSYPEKILMDYCNKHGWIKKEITKIVSVSGKRKNTKYKIECLTYNYQPPQLTMDLFSSQ